MPSDVTGNPEFTVGNSTFQFVPGQADPKTKVPFAELGKFYVIETVKDSSGKTTSTQRAITLVDLMVIIYAAKNVQANNNITDMTKVAEAISNYTTAASNLAKVFGLYAAAFDGEFYKSGMAPEGSIGSGNQDISSLDFTLYNNESNRPITMQSKAAHMTIAHAAEIIQSYDDLVGYYNELSSDEFKDILESSGIQLSLPAYPFSSSEFKGLDAYDKVLSSSASGNSWTVSGVKILSSSAAQSEDYNKNVNIGWSNAFGDFGKFTNQFSGKSAVSLSLGTMKYEDKQNKPKDGSNTVYRLYTNNDKSTNNWVGYTSVTGKIYYTTAGANATREQKAEAMAYQHFASSTDGNLCFNASKANENKETWNNEMSKFNTNLQLVMQELNRATSKADSNQAMFDKAIDGAFNNYNSIAGW